MMSPIYHPAMKIVSPVRKKLKVKTVFNILGPMLNPARVPYAVVGVYKEELVGDKLSILAISLEIFLPLLLKFQDLNLCFICWGLVMAQFFFF